MFKLKVVSVEKVFSQSQNEFFLDVECAISKGKKFVETRKLGFPLDTTEKVIQNKLKKYIAQYNAEQKMFKENKEKDRVAKQSNKVIELVEGTEL